MKIIELKTLPEMLAQLSIIQQLYPKMSLKKYEEYLQEMLPHRYTQIAVFEDNICVGLTGCWFGVKLWSGKYVEIDNFIVDKKHRKKGIGKLMTDYVHAKASKLGCTMIVLDAFTANYTAHKFYYNQGFEPRGFHFLNILDENGLS